MSLKPYINYNFFSSQMLEHGVMVRTCEAYLAPGLIQATIGTRESSVRVG